MFKNTYIYILLIALPSLNISSQVKHATKITKASIKTLEMHVTGQSLSSPIIELGSTQTITFSFDDLTSEEMSYQYKLIHCDADFHASKLHASEFTSGFYKGFIEDYSYSFNTNIDYIHYSLEIPNDMMKITKSGNYALLVFLDDETNPVLTACFYVYESLVDIRTKMDFNTEKGFRNKYQQLNINILHPHYQIDNAILETQLIVKQNERIDNMATDLKPTFIRPGALSYEKNEALIFDGGNEYLYFDATTSKYNAHGIAGINFHRPYEHFVLHPFIPEPTKNYSYHEDVNGKFVVRRQEADQEALDTESDYIFAHFAIPRKAPDFTGKLYLLGEFSFNAILPDFEMQYTIERAQYECDLLLKQGRYEYRYLFTPKGTSRGQSNPFDGDYFETENDYQVFFYHRPVSARYDRLVGYRLINSLNSDR